MHMFSDDFRTIRKRKIDEYLDGGYIIIDYDKRVIINCQECFIFSELTKENFRQIIC